MNIDLSKFDRFKVSFQKGDQIFCEYEPGDSFYLIQSGRVQIVKIMGDIEKIVDILHPGEIFGEMAILEEAPRSASAIAIDHVEVLEFNKKNFEILLRGNPQIAMKLLQTFIKRIYDQKRRFMILTLPDPQAKVADVFLMLSETQSAESKSMNEIVLNTNVDDLAHWCGLTTSECKQVINHFVTQRKIEIENDKLVIKNINDFQRFVNSRRKK
ncbi:MAG: Crp/Fnr family transcriptional regulator [Spirochaetia bacterium]|jgi:CRP-like cAMP-binding protein|nr:Crp/Fnr family transcriptional regulator [Spirochaetia bacterium]